MGKIITVGEVKDMNPSIDWGDIDLIKLTEWCPTKSFISSLTGHEHETSFLISGNYDDNQLVQETDLYRNFLVYYTAHDLPLYALRLLGYVNGTFEVIDYNLQVDSNVNFENNWGKVLTIDRSVVSAAPIRIQVSYAVDQSGSYTDILDKAYANDEKINLEFEYQQLFNYKLRSLHLNAYVYIKSSPVVIYNNSSHDLIITHCILDSNKNITKEELILNPGSDNVNNQIYIVHPDLMTIRTENNDALNVVDIIGSGIPDQNNVTLYKVDYLHINQTAENSSNRICELEVDDYIPGKSITIKNNATRGTLTLSGGYSTTISQGASKTITINSGSSALQFSLSGASSSAQYQVTGGGANYTGYGTYSLAVDDITNNGTIIISDYNSNRKNIDFVVNDPYSTTYKVKSYTAAGTVLYATNDAHYKIPITLNVENGGTIEVDKVKPNAIFRIFIPAFMDDINTLSNTNGRISFGLNSGQIPGYDWSSLDSIEIDYHGDV
jgi:hypothetical protein